MTIRYTISLSIQFKIQHIWESFSLDEEVYQAGVKLVLWCAVSRRLH